MTASLRIACLTCSSRIAYQQGCCVACLWRHRAAIKLGRTTWSDLVERGLALPFRARTAKERPAILKFPALAGSDATREIRCLSIMQPWAALVIHGAKRYETRGWSTYHRGEIGIHVSRTFSMESRWLCRREPFRSVLTAAGYPDEYALPTGVVVGTAELVECVPCESLRDLDEREQDFGNFRQGRWAYRFEKPRLFPEPIPAKGSVGIFTLKLAV